MLKVRVMPTLLYRGSGLVKGVGFDSWRPIGSVMQAVKVYNMRQVDELVFLDVDATAHGREPDYELIDEIADECFMPFAVGGGIRSVDHVEKLLRVGADKVVVGTGAHEVTGLVASIAERFGSQAVVASIDARQVGNSWEVLTRSGSRETGRCPIEMSIELATQGAGEILLTSVERDGAMTGYDIELTRRVSAAVDVPVIASGGAGNAADIVDVITNGSASAAAAASLFHFTEVTPNEVKSALSDAGVAVRF